MLTTVEAGASRLGDAGHVLNFCPNLSGRFCPHISRNKPILKLLHVTCLSDQLVLLSAPAHFEVIFQD
jgi:hypothetical protein